MRPVRLDVDPFDVDADAIAESQTPSAGGLQALTLNGVAADLGTAGQFNIEDVYSSAFTAVPITITSAGDESGVVFAIVGKDKDGVMQTVAIAGPNATTITTSSTWSEITAITVDGNTTTAITIGLPAVVNTKVIPIDWRDDEGAVVAIAGLAGTIDFDIEETFDNVLIMDADNANFITKAANLTTNGTTTLSVHATAVRIKINSSSAGEFQATIVSN